MLIKLMPPTLISLKWRTHTSIDELALNEAGWDR